MTREAPSQKSWVLLGRRENLELWSLLRDYDDGRSDAQFVGRRIMTLPDGSTALAGADLMFRTEAQGREWLVSE